MKEEGEKEKGGVVILQWISAQGCLSIDRNDNVQYVGKAISYESSVQQVENIA